MGVDEMGVDKMGVDQMESRQSGMTPSKQYKPTHRPTVYRCIAVFVYYNFSATFWTLSVVYLGCTDPLF